ncbi:DnaJ-domain-containing protein [Mycena pura]|uniref:DnaJ-domain-containing protein n=1 Tax=Mycena pura TaxID=153505 RepID=A0AAD6VT26_9AGAR|nr:DnaJ-domain-containing protein [Mycena pura]
MKLSIDEAYRTLGLENGAPLEVVKTTYKQVALHTHPDKNPNNPNATAQFQKVSEAYSMLLKHLDTSRGPSRFPGDNSDFDEEYYDYDSDEYEEENLAFYMFLFEEMMRGRANRFAGMRFRAQHAEPEAPEEYAARLRRSREEQVAGEERRKREAAARRARAEIDREREREAAEERQKAKVEAKKANAQAHRSKAEAAARAAQQQLQIKRSSVFSAARAGKHDKVKAGVWAESVDAAGGEVKAGCEVFVKNKPNDPQETLLHIAARNGDKELVSWLDTHGADPEERDSSNLTAFHVALKCGHITVVAYFFEAYPPEESDSSGIYNPPESKSLLSIALESYEPELVWMILDKRLATEEEINLSWAWITSNKGRTSMKSLQAGRKAKPDGENRFEDIMQLLMRYGGFTPPPTPVAEEQKEVPRSHKPEQHPSQSRTSVQESNMCGMVDERKSMHAGRGRGRGRARGFGRGAARS